MYINQEQITPKQERETALYSLFQPLVVPECKVLLGAKQVRKNQPGDREKQGGSNATHRLPGVVKKEIGATVLSGEGKCNEMSLQHQQDGQRSGDVDKDKTLMNGRGAHRN